MAAKKENYQADTAGPARMSPAISKRTLKGAGSRKKYLPYLIVLPALALTLPVLVPFIQSIYYSMTTYSLTNPVKNFHVATPRHFDTPASAGTNHSGPAATMPESYC